MHRSAFQSPIKKPSRLLGVENELKNAYLTARAFAPQSSSESDALNSTEFDPLDLKTILENSTLFKNKDEVVQKCNTSTSDSQSHSLVKKKSVQGSESISPIGVWRLIYLFSFLFVLFLVFGTMYINQ